MGVQFSIRRPALFSLPIITALIVAVAVTTPALAGATQDFYAATNAARASAGLPALKQSGDLAAVAQAWAEQMASTGKLAHNPNLQTQVKNWRYVGENVGTGGTVAAIQDAFMKSPNHRSNILDTDFTEVGIGTATRFNDQCQCDVLYVTVNFRQPLKAATSSPAPAPAPTQVATPKPAPKPTSSKPAVSKPAVSKPSSKPAPSKPASIKPTTPTVPPSPSPLAATVKAQLAAAAAQSSSAADPVSQALDFAALIARLGG
jgi:hypothetical protein